MFRLQQQKKTEVQFLQLSACNLYLLRLSILYFLKKNQKKKQKKTRTIKTYVLYFHSVEALTVCIE
jgi:hypothetical protein